MLSSYDAAQPLRRQVSPPSLVQDHTSPWFQVRSESDKSAWLQSSRMSIVNLAKLIWQKNSFAPEERNVLH